MTVGAGGRRRTAADLAGAPLWAEELLLLEAAFNQAPIGMGLTDADGRYVRVNSSLCRLLDRTQQDLLGQKFTAHVHPDDVPVEVERLASLVEGTSAEYEADSRRVRPDGTVLWVHERVSVPLAGGGEPLFGDEHGRPAYVIRQLVDVSNERALINALATAERKALDASTAKTELLFRVSHELRTPLSAVVGYAELLDDPRLGLRPAQREAIAEIDAAGRHLVRLVDELLDIARAEQGRLAVAVGPVDVADVLREAAGLVRAEAEAAGQRVVIEPAPVPCPPVAADRTRLVEILLNLLSNAVKYCPAGPDVRLCAGVAGDRVEITVRDRGPGLSAAQQRRLFTPFERLGAEQRGIPGTGLGLAVSRRLAEAMGGALTLESRVSAGSTFTVSLRAATVRPEGGPVAAAPAAPARAGPVRPDPRLTGRRWSVLYVEDNPASARLVDAVLARFTDADLAVARTGREGLERVAAAPPDVVLLDLGLPDLDGREVLARLRAAPDSSAIPVVVVSADAAPATAAELLAAGADAFVSKPVVVGDLLDALAGALERVCSR